MEFQNHKDLCSGFLISLESFERLLSGLKTIKSKRYHSIDLVSFCVQYNFYNGRTIYYILDVATNLLCLTIACISVYSTSFLLTQLTVNMKLNAFVKTIDQWHSQTFPGGGAVFLQNSIYDYP